MEITISLSEFLLNTLVILLSFVTGMLVESEFGITKRVEHWFER